jgi:hypothetical protein
MQYDNAEENTHMVWQSVGHEGAADILKDDSSCVMVRLFETENSSEYRIVNRCS